MADPTYLGPDPMDPNSHQVMTPDGQTVSVPFMGLTPQLQDAAVQSALAPATPAGGTPGIIRTGPGSGTTYDPTTGAPMAPPVQGPAPMSDDDMAAAAAGIGPGAKPPVSAAPTPASPIPPNVGFGPQGASASAAAPPGFVPPTGGRGGGGSSATDPNLQQSFTDKLAAANTGYQLNKGLSSDELALGKSQAADAANRTAQFQQQDQASQQLQNDALQRANAATTDFMNQKVDPNAYWNNKSTGDKIWAAASMMLSGVGAGFTGQQNMAAKVYQDAQDQDLAAQKYNIEHKKDASQQYQSLFRDYQAAGLDRRTAFQATDLAIKAKNQQDMENAVLAHGGQAALQQFQTATAGNREDLAVKTAALQQQHAATQAAYSGMATQSLDRQKSSYDFAKEKYLDKIAPGGIAPSGKLADNYVPGVDGAPGQYAANPKLAENAVGSHSALDPAISAVSKLVDWTQANGNTVRPSAVATGKGLASNAKALIMNSDDIKRLSPESQAFFARQIPDDPTSFFQVLPQLKTALSSLQDKRDTLDTVNGLKPTRRIQESAAGSK